MIIMNTLNLSKKTPVVDLETFNKLQHVSFNSIYLTFTSGNIDGNGDVGIHFKKSKNDHDNINLV